MKTKKDYQEHIDRFDKQLNYLSQREALLSHREETEYWDSKIVNDATGAYLELMSKVLSSPEGESKNFWVSNMKKFIDLMKRHDKLLIDLNRLSLEYNLLYRRYDEIIDKYNSLEQEYREKVFGEQ